MLGHDQGGFSFLKEFIQKYICGRGFLFNLSKGDLLEFYPCLLVLLWECPFLYLQRATVWWRGENMGLTVRK